jgi:hypothetical protein
MILKYKRADIWCFIDGIESLSVVPEENGNKTICLFGKFANSDCREVPVSTKEAVYLLNNDGKTIECLN